MIVYGAGIPGTECSGCGVEAPDLTFLETLDGYATGDSPTMYEFRGTACCSSPLHLIESGTEVDPHDVIRRN